MVDVIVESKRHTGKKQNSNYWIKNAELVRARQSLGYSNVKEAASAIGIDYQAYKTYEHLLVFPNSDVQEKIKTFYREHDIVFDDSVAFSNEIRDLSRLMHDGPLKEEDYDETLLFGVSCGYMPGPEEEYRKTIQGQPLEDVLSRVMDTLTPRQAYVLTKNFDLDGNGKQTLEEIGRTFNIKRERVRQIKEEALHRMRQYSRRNALVKFLDASDF